MPFFLNSCGCGNGEAEQRPSIKSILYDRKQDEKPKKLCLFFDGTDNDHDSQTHIRHLYELISSKNSFQTISYYDTGVGAEVNKIGGMLGGKGFSKNLAQAYAFLAENYRKGDKVYLFGYSRGARQAHTVSDLILTMNLPNKNWSRDPKDQSNNLRKAKSIVSEYQNAWRKSIRDQKKAGKMNPNNVERPVIANKKAIVPTVEGLYLWDNVESMANNVWTIAGRFYGSAIPLPGKKYKPFCPVSYSQHYTYTYQIHPKVKECYHAMALDEIRGLYEVIPLIKTKGSSTEVENVWFAGSHGDIGGSYEESEALAACSLNWILSKIEKKGLIPNGRFRVKQDSTGVSVNSRQFTLPGVVLSWVRKDRYRRQQLWGEFWSHYAKGNSKRDCPSKNFKPRIHESVIERLKAQEVWLQDGDKFSLNGNNKAYVAKIFMKPDKDEPVLYKERCYNNAKRFLPVNSKNSDIIKFIEKRMKVVE